MNDKPTLADATTAPQKTDYSKMSLYDIMASGIQAPPLTNHIQDNKTAADVANGQKENTQGFGGDAVDAFQKGAFDAAAGAAETVNLITGSETAGKFRDAANNRSKDQIDQMSQAGQEAMGKQFFSEDEYGRTQFGEAWTDPRAFGLQVSALAGQMVPQVVGGLGIYSLGAKVGGNIVFKAAAKQAAARGLAAEEAAIYAKGVTSAAFGTGGQAIAEAGIAGGMMGVQAREEVLGMSNREQDESNEFRKIYRALSQQNPNESVDNLRKMSAKTLADRVARAVETDPALVTSNLVLGAVGGRFIDNMLRGVGTGSRLTNAAQQAVVQGGTEGVQGGLEQNTLNRAMIDEGADSDRNPMQGVISSALNEGIMGGALGGAMGGIQKGAPRERLPEGQQPIDAVQTDENGRVMNPVKQGPSINPQSSVDPAPSMSLDDAVSQIKAERGQYKGIDDDIRIAEEQGFNDEAVRLRAAKRNFEMAADFANEGDNESAKRFNERALKIYRDVTQMGQRDAEAPEPKSQLPAEYVAIGEYLERTQESYDEMDRVRVNNLQPEVSDYEPDPSTLIPSTVDAPYYMGPTEEAKAAKAKTEDAFTKQQGNQPPVTPPTMGVDELAYGDAENIDAVDTVPPVVEVVELPPTMDVREGESLNNDDIETIRNLSPEWLESAPGNVKRITFKGFQRAVDKASQSKPLSPIEERAVKYALDSIANDNNKNTETDKAEAQEEGTVFTDESYPDIDGVDAASKKIADRIKSSLDAGVPESVITKIAQDFGGNPAEFESKLSMFSEEYKSGQEITPSSTEGAPDQRALEEEPASQKEPDRYTPEKQERLKPKTPANAGVSVSVLPEILTTTRKAYLKKMATAQGVKRNSPGYDAAVAKIEENYESAIDEAQASLTFEQFNKLNSETPESLNRQAWESLREEYGIKNSKLAENGKIKSQEKLLEVDPGVVEFPKRMRDNASGFLGVYDGKRMTPMALDFVDKYLSLGRSLDDAEKAALAKKYNVRADIIDVLETNNGFGSENLKTSLGRRYLEYVSRLKKSSNANGGPIRNTVGNPFKTIQAAKAALKKNPGYEVSPTDGGFELTRIPEGSAVARNGNMAKPTKSSATDINDDFGPDLNNEIEAAASEAATSPLNDTPEPTKSQMEAGNYKKGHVNINGLDISIENPRGSIRSGIDNDGESWSVKMAHHYGYIKKTEGADGEHIDVYIGRNPESQKVFIVDQVNPDGSFDEHKVMVGFKTKGQATSGYRANYTKGWKVGPVTEMSMDEFKEWIESGNTNKPFSEKEKSQSSKSEINDFGETIQGAKKHIAKAVRDRLADMDDADIAQSTLSKLWPKSEIDNIKDDKAAALYHSIRAEIPSKPRVEYKVQRWVDTVKAVRNLVDMTEDLGVSAMLDRMRASSESLKGLSDKVEILSSIDRKHWDRVGSVRTASGKYQNGAGKMVSGSWYDVNIDGRYKAFYGSEKVSDFISDFKELIESKPTEQNLMKVDIYSRRDTGKAYIAARTDKEKRPLKEFNSASDARKFLGDKNNYSEIEAAWSAIKERDNVSKKDIRNPKNAARIGEDYRNGKDVTPEQFTETFGFRGIQFGNYVKQGSGSRDRQGMLNGAYDALIDLAGVVGVPPKALSLNGELGLAFGARGSGGASAHYEAGQIVINLTKSSGPGSLAHEWFHAMDHYFQRKRGEAKSSIHGGPFITFQPETYYRDKTTDAQIPAVDFEAMAEGGVSRSGKRFLSSRFNRDNWEKIEGVRPEVASAFASLVETLDATPMHQRAKKIDAGKKDGYWSRVIERAARSFENYVIAKMADSNKKNDYLANVAKLESFKRNPERYPYILDEEMAPVKDAFDRLFEIIETKETKNGVALYSLSKKSDEKPATRSRAKKVKEWLNDSIKDMPSVEVVETATGLPVRIQMDLGEFINEAEGAYDVSTGKSYIIADKIKDQYHAKRVFLHEVVGHGGVINHLKKNAKNGGKAYLEMLDDIYYRAGNARVNKEISRYSFDYDNPDERRTAVLEYIAHLAEQGRSMGLVRRVIAALRDFVRKLNPDIEWTDTDTLALIERGRLHLKKYGNKGKGAANDKPLASAKKDQSENSSILMRVSDVLDRDNQESPIRSKVGDLLDALRYQVQDKLIDLKREQQDIEDLDDSANAYQKAAIWEGKAGERLNDFDEQRVQPLLEKVAETKLSLEEVGEWLVARHAEEANAYLAEINPDKPEDERFRLSGMSNEDAASILASRKDNAALQEIGTMVDSINSDRVDMLINEGLIEEDMASAWRSRYKNYVPLNREEAEGGDYLPSRGQGFQIKGKESKQRTGSAYWKPGKILSHVIANYESSIVRAEKNKVGEALLKFVEENPNDDFWQIDTERRMKVVRNGKVVEGAKMFSAPNELTVKRNGVEHVIVFNPNNQRAARLAKGMKNLQASEMNTVMRGLASFTRFLATINTSFNPEFMVSNFFRDVQTAAYNLSNTELQDMKAKVIKDIFPAMNGIRSALFGDGSAEWSDVWEDFRLNGGKTGWLDLHSDIKSKENDLKKMIERVRDGKAPKAAWRKVFDGIENMNNVVENAVRLSAYKHSIDAGLSKEKAAALAKDLTVNFNRKGAMGPQLNAFYMFFNAAVQGNVRLLQAMVNSKKGQALAVGTVGFAVMLDIMNRSMAGDDDDGENLYDALPDYVKDRNIIIMGEKEPIIKIPAPWGYNTLHVIGQEIGKAMSSGRFDALESASRIGTSFVDAFNPLSSGSISQMLSPTISDPIVQIAENKNFAGNPLMPEHTFDAFRPSPEYQMHFSTARQGSKELTEFLNDITGGNEVRPGAINISPEVIDLLVDTFTGGAGRTVANTGDFVARLATGKELETENIPFLRKVTGFNNDYGIKGRYYEWSKGVGYSKDEAKKLTGEELIEAKKRPEYKLVGIFNQTERELRGLRKRRRALEKNGADDKQLEQMDEQIRRTMARFNKQYVRVMFN